MEPINQEGSAMSRFPEDPKQDEEAQRAPEGAGEPHSQPPEQPEDAHPRPDTIGPRGNQETDEADVERGAEKLDRVITH